MSAGRVAGKVVVVTGAAGGQGAAEVGWLVREGATVVATDVGDDAPGYPAGAGTVSYHRLDVSRPDDWDALVDVVREHHGVVHGLVNNAGVTHRARLGDVTLEDWNRVLAVNVTGALLGIQALTPLMPPGVVDRQRRLRCGAHRALHRGVHREQVGAAGIVARREHGARPARDPRQLDPSRATSRPR